MSFDTLFPPEAIKALMIGSLMSVGLLAGLFFYLNRFTRRPYFSIWAAAWMFYAAWLLMSLEDVTPGLWHWTFKHWSLGTAAALFVWGSLRFMGRPTPRRLLVLFLGFLFVWSATGAFYLKDSLAAQIPIFGLVGVGGVATSAGFWSLRRRSTYVGAGLLAAGFLLWGLYHAASPFVRQVPQFGSMLFLVSAGLQLFIAVSMIVLALEEVRQANESIQIQVDRVRSEHTELESRLSAAEEERRSLFKQARLSEDLQRAYDELRQKQETVLQEERLRALGQMASGIAHDINNALSPVLVYSDLLLGAERSLSETGRRYLDHIKNSGSDIACIVARMKEFSRSRDESDPVVPVQLNRVVEEVLCLTRPGWRDTAQKNGVMIEVRTDLDTTLPPLRGVEFELREALTNLVLNSIDALQRDGVLTLRTRTVPAAADSPNDEGCIIVEVCDTGVGMDEESRQRCLEPFFSTKGQRGTGLGLPMVFGVVERHEGRIEIESGPGKGTVVRLMFPARATEAAMTSVVPTGTANSHPLRVLCIDDEPMLRELLKEALECDGHSVETAEGGAAGIQTFSTFCRQGEPFDVVITDLGMPLIDGRQVARDIKGESPATPVLMLTGWGSFMKEEGDIPVHVDGIISKPPRVDDLRFALQEIRRTGAGRRKLMIGF